MRPWAMPSTSFQYNKTTGCSLRFCVWDKVILGFHQKLVVLAHI